MYISSFENIFKTITAKTYIITATTIAIIVAIFSTIIPFNILNIKYEQIPIINVAIKGLKISLEKPKFNFIFFNNVVNAIVNAII